MAKSITTINIDINANSKGVKRGIDEANKELEGFRRRMRQWEQIGNIATGINSAIGITRQLIGTFQQLTAGINQSARAAEELGRTAQRLGTDTNTLRGLTAWAEQTGISINQMETAFQRFRRRSAEAAIGTGSAVKALEELNLNAEELIGLKLDEALEMAADAFAQVSNESDRLRLAMALFDTEGVKLLHLLDEMASTSRTAAEEAERLGLALSGQAEDNLVRSSQALTELTQTWQSFRTQAHGAASEHLATLYELGTAYLQWSRRTQQWFDNLVGREGPVEFKDFGSADKLAERQRKAQAEAEAQAKKLADEAKAFADQEALAQRYIEANRTELERLNDELSMLYTWGVDGVKTWEELAVHIERVEDAIRKARQELGADPSKNALVDMVDSTGAAIEERFMEIEDIGNRIMGSVGVAGATSAEAGFQTLARAQSKAQDDEAKRDRGRDRLLASIDRKIDRGPTIRVIGFA